MAATKMAKVTLIPKKYINDKFKGVRCRLLRPPEVDVDCQMELDVNADGAHEFVEAAQEHVKAYVDKTVGIVVSEFPKMEKKVEAIALKFCQAWPQDKSQRELERKLEEVLDKEKNAHNTILNNAMKGIQAGVPGAVEAARKEIGRRKKAILQMKVKTVAKFAVATGITIGVTMAAIIGLVGGVAAIVLSGGTAAIVFAAVGATVVGACVSIAAAAKSAAGSADSALKELKTAMKKVGELGVLKELNDLPTATRKDKWKALKAKLSPAFQALEVKVRNYRTHVLKVRAAGSKASNQYDKLQTQADKLTTKIKQELSKNKDAAGDRNIKELIAKRDMLEKAATKVIQLQSENLRMLDDYEKKIDAVGEIVADYKRDTPPALQKANAILATMREIGPSLADILKLVQATGKTSSDLSKTLKAGGA